LTLGAADDALVFLVGGILEDRVTLSSSGSRMAHRKKVAAWCWRYWSFEREAASSVGYALLSREWITGRSVGITLRK